MLVGKYIVVATPLIGPDGVTDYAGPCVMTNWLEIVDEYAEVVTSRRGRNFQAREALPVTRFL